MVLRVCDRFLKHIHAAHLGGAGWFFFCLSPFLFGRVVPFALALWDLPLFRYPGLIFLPFTLPSWRMYVQKFVYVCDTYVHLFWSCNFVTCSVYEKRINNAQIAISESVTWNFEGGEGRNGGRRR